MSRLPASLAASLLLAASTTPACPRDYGTSGTVFPVIERDLLETIHSRLVTLEQSGATARLNDDLKRRTIARVNRPVPVTGLSPAETPRSWLFDPTITLGEDISDAQGRLIMARGTRVNPLDTVPLRSVLVFLDGDQPQELAWALDLAKRRPVKLILAKGAPLDLMRAHQTRFYFDQGGTLIAHFRIAHLPALVEQHGRALKVSEIVLPPSPRAPS